MMELTKGALVPAMHQRRYPARWGYRVIACWLLLVLALRAAIYAAVPAIPIPILRYSVAGRRSST